MQRAYFKLMYGRLIFFDLTANNQALIEKILSYYSRMQDSGALKGIEKVKIVYTLLNEKHSQEVIVS